MGLSRDLRQAWRLPVGAWADLATASAELALARVRLATQDADSLIAAQPAGGGGAAAIGNRDRTIDRVRFAIPRMGARVPWHATCLVQAIAAQHWLARKGIPSSVQLGVRKPTGAAIDAHAWLEADGRLVVGGEVGDYSRFKPSRPD